MLAYLPTHLLLRAVDAKWMLPAAQLPDLPKDYDRSGLFLLRPHTAYFKYGYTGAQVNVRRTHFQVVPADTRIVYAAQGEGFDACVVDMARPPRMGTAVFWLSLYVMLSRATSLTGLLILRLCSRTSQQAHPTSSQTRSTACST